MRDGRWLTASQCAERIGVTIRTLRLYEQVGLIQPRRTPKNWRLYGASDILRLKEILALRQLGLSLQHITLLLNNEIPDIEQVLG